MRSSLSKIYPLGGVWQILADDGILHTLRLPGTLEENNIGHPDYGTEDVDKTVSGQAPEDAQERFLRSEGLLSEREGAMPAPTEPILTRYTRKYVYEGAVRISRMLTFEEHLGKRYFFEKVPRNPTGKIEKVVLRERYCKDTLVNEQLKR